ncbi:glycosyltransferase family 39 protein [Mycolicibacillus trivialis]|uniref:glycosyltransferase family 39 protein n=1 Tax=Mycolicibacillus trivialis TaxID=1798 RepID=UPI003B3A6185
MTAPPPAVAPPRRWHRRIDPSTWALGALLAATAVLYLWGLSAGGWANAFYAAAAQAGAADPTAFLFGSSDAANAITVDKPPAALWVMSASVWLFGLNSWSLLVPQALQGVAAVGVLYAAVRRVAGARAGLLAGTLLAVTPVATLMFRYNNPDALLVLLLVLAAYAVQRALSADSGSWWLPLAGVMVGFAFLTKMLQALVVVPVFAAVYVLAADTGLRTRLRRLLGGLGALVASAGWYLVLVELWPASARPYIGGSQHNSIIELTLGYNGLGRLTGDEVGGLGNTNHDVGAARLFGPSMGDQIGWLLPAALIAIPAALWITRGRARTDPVRAAVLLWGGWLVVTGGVFSFANGILHPYYTVALAPAIAATVAIGTVLLWRRRAETWAAAALAAMMLVTAGFAYLLLDRTPAWSPGLRIAVLAAGLIAAALLAAAGRLPAAAARALAVTAVVVGLAAPTAYSVATVAHPSQGALPTAGPARHGPHGPPPPRDGGPRRGGPPQDGGIAALLFPSTPGPALTALLRGDAEHYTWAAATVGSNRAAGYQLAARAPVMAVGGYNGTDPAPTLDRFRQLVAAGRIHFFVGGAPPTPRHQVSGSREAARIAAWVTRHFPARTVDGVEVYDLSRGFTAGA